MLYKLWISLLIFLKILTFIRGYPDGAPERACFIMVPRHTHPHTYRPIFKQHGASPYNITLSRTTWRYDTAIRVTIGGAPFKGFMLTACEDGHTDWPTGVFYSESPDARPLWCVDRNDAITHNNSNWKSSVTVLWYGPQFSSADHVVFIATVVTNRTTYWTAIKSAMIVQDATQTAAGGGGEAPEGGAQPGMMPGLDAWGYPTTPSWNWGGGGGGRGGGGGGRGGGGGEGGFGMWGGGGGRGGRGGQGGGGGGGENTAGETTTPGWNSNSGGGGSNSAWNRWAMSNMGGGGWTTTQSPERSNTWAPSLFGGSRGGGGGGGGGNRNNNGGGSGGGWGNNRGSNGGNGGSKTNAWGNGGGGSNQGANGGGGQNWGNGGNTPSGGGGGNWGNNGNDGAGRNNWGNNGGGQGGRGGGGNRGNNRTGGGGAMNNWQMRLMRQLLGFKRR